MLLEPVSLKIPIFKTTVTQWLTKNLSIDKDKSVLYITSKNWAVHEDWSFHTEHTVNLKTDNPQEELAKHEENQFDYIFIVDHVLSNNSEQKQLINECLRIIKKGGRIIAWERAGDSESEIVDFLYPKGFDISSLIKERLNNKDIARLRPKDAALFKTVTVFPSTQSFYTNLQTYFPDISYEYIVGYNKEQFVVSYLTVLLIWEKV